MRRLTAFCLACGCGVWLGCGERGARRIERAEDAGAGVVIVHRTSDGVRIVDEVEPNDEAGAAMEVVLPAGVEGKLAGAGDVDRYRVDIAEPGALYVEITGIDEVDLILELTDADGKVLAHCDNGPGKVSEGFPNYPVEAGRYWVVVREFTKKRAKPREGDSPPYRLTVKMAPAPLDTQELEPNSAIEAARPVVIGGEVRGFVGWRRDRDVWSVPTEGLGEGDVVDFDVDAVPGVELTLELLRGSQVALQRSGANGQSLAVRGWVPEPGDDTAVYLAITGKRSSFEEPYVVRAMRRTAGFDEENEPNDTVATAATLAVSPGAPGGARRGHLPPGDVDVYAVPVARGRQELQIVIEPGTPSLDVAVSLVGEGGEALAEADAGNKGGIERISGAGIVAGTRTFVRIARKSSRDAADEDTVAPYSLRWSLTGGDVIPKSMFE